MKDTNSSKQTVLLGVNIDHVATLRQARKTNYPNLLDAALLAEKAGADYITMHLREDRRHIQDKDLLDFSKHLKTWMNLELAVTDEMIAIAEGVQPRDCCLVPERREELTTEGGLDVKRQLSKVREACLRLSASNIKVSIFIDADMDQIDAAKQSGAPVIEIHTGHYANTTGEAQAAELLRITKAARHATNLGLQVNAGHGLHCDNVQAIANIPDIKELNIGHSIICRAIFVGLEQAVKEIKDKCRS